MKFTLIARKPQNKATTIPPVLAQGLYLARIHDDRFEMQVPGDFQVRRFERVLST